MSALPWFRLYHRMVDDEKLRLLAFEDRWHFVALCCLKADGLLDTPNTDLRGRKIAVKLGIQVRELEEVARRLSEVGLIDENLNPMKWEELQQRSDSSNDRVKKYREKRKANGLSSGSEGYLKHQTALMERDGGACIYCGVSDHLCIDHMVPIAQGGTDHIDNLAIACKGCNSGKSGRTPEQAAYKILSDQAREALSRYVTVTETGKSRAREDREEDKEEAKASCPSSDEPALKPEHIFERWNETAATLGKPRVRDLTPERRQLLKARIAQYALDDFLTVFGKIEGSAFLRGDTGWRGCAFDWVFKKANFQKILEGNYDE